MKFKPLLIFCVYILFGEFQLGTSYNKRENDEAFFLLRKTVKGKH